MDGSRARNPWPYVVLLLALIGAAALTFALAGGEEEARGQTVRFQSPTEPGPDPFTKPADVKGKKTVKVGSGPFGGTGSDLVCDRELLISSLRARPDRMRAWAETLNIEPTNDAVARYIRSLRPVTLVRDTRVTNHSFSGGQVVTFQAVLQAGTAVLVDKDGKPVARCRCGNPLAAPLDYPEAICIGCPVNYDPPPPCRAYTDCYRRYPNPPRIHVYRRKLRCDPPRSQAEFERCRDRNLLPKQHMGTDATEPPDPPSNDNGPASATFYPQFGTTEDTYTLEGRAFAPNSTVSITLTRPDGVTERYRFRTDSSGTGSYTFPNTGPSTVLGTYTAVVSGGGETVTTTTTVRTPDAGPEGENHTPDDEPRLDQSEPAGPEVGGGTDCTNPQSADEVELCGG